MYCDGRLLLLIKCRRDLSLRLLHRLLHHPQLLPLRGRGPLSAEDEVAHRRLGVADGAADLDEARAGAVEAGLGQPGQRDAERLRDLRWVQQRIDLVSLCGGSCPPPFVPGDGPKMRVRFPQKKRYLPPNSG